MEHPQVAVQLVRHRLAVEVDAGREYNQLEPLGHLDKEQTLYVNTFYTLLNSPQRERSQHEVSCEQRISPDDCRCAL